MTNPGRVVRQVADSRRPVLLTSRGRGVAVVQSVAEYEAAEEEREFMRAVVQGIADVEAGREVSIEEVRARLGHRVTADGLSRSGSPSPRWRFSRT